MRNKVCIIDYGVNNILSISKALKKLNISFEIVNESKLISEYSHIILPGVGSFDNGIENLKKKKIDIEITKAVNKGSHLFGICLGMQLLFNKSEESLRDFCGLNLIEGNVKKISHNNKNKIFVPHVGWNRIVPFNHNVFFEDCMNNDFYFVHSFYVEPKDTKLIISTFKHGRDYPAVIKKNNIIGTQFHPEKCDLGLEMIRNFCNL